MAQVPAMLVFWGAALLLFYTYFGYPLLIGLWAWLRPRPVAKATWLPMVSVLVVARNEAARIQQRVANLLALDYPPALLELVVASDASTDETLALAREYGGKRLRVIDCETHRGKPAVLNEVLPSLLGEIVVLMDVRQVVEPDALHALVANLADPEVGAVSGELHLLENSGGNDGVGFYWRYEKWIRRQESCSDSTVGVTGALYALRRLLFRPIPADTLLDDVLIPLQIACQGWRVVFEPLARASEQVTATPAAEFRRKVRTIAGNYQLFSRESWLLDPLANRLWWQTLSHKGCRLLGPLSLLLLLGSNLLLSGQSFYRVLLVLQALFYVAALAGHLGRHTRFRPLWLTIPQAFCLLNWSTAVGCYRYFSGTQQVTWEQASVLPPVCIKQ
jgi:biofilm PGA synthesis N-glycosyltransferase PgaC